MKKQEFLNKLRKKLNVLEDKEIEDIISEYAGYIEEKVNRGLTEEEAVKELGDINEIANDLLQAYKVKPKESNYLNRFINKVSQMFDYFLNELSNKSGKDILKLIVEICLIIFLIMIFRIPFLLVKDLGWNIFEGLASPISNIFYGIWSFIVEASYFVLAIILFIKIIEKRYFQGFSEKIVNEIEDEQPKKKKVKTSKKEETKEEPVMVKEVPQKRTSIIDMITNICILFLKFIVIMCLFGVICYLIGMTFALGIGIYLLIKGVTYFGLLILLIALFQSGILLLELGINFVLNKRMKRGHILAEIITIVILTGVGLSLGTIEIANTEIIYDSSYTETKKVTKEIEVSENLALYGDYDIIIDNTLENKIIIEYIYPDINNIEVSISLNYYDNGYYLDERVNNLSWNKEMLNQLIEDLKDKKIYVNNFDIKKNVYMSEETKELLFKNKEINNNDNDTIYEFTQTYNVRNIEESNNDAYLYLTLRQFEAEEVTSVRVSRSLAKNIEIGNNYEFTFRYNYSNTNLKEGSIAEIFEKCNLVSINYTDKIGVEQVQESGMPQI